jgi:histone-lysine N-methyltransferase SETD3
MTLLKLNIYPRFVLYHILICTFSLQAMSDDPLLGRMENVSLAIYLLCETMRRSESKWAPYINILPSTYTTPLYYTVEQLQLLRCSGVFDMSLKMYRSIVRQFAYFHVLLATANSAKHKVGMIYCFQIFLYLFIII